MKIGQFVVVTAETWKMIGSASSLEQIEEMVLE